MGSSFSSGDLFRGLGDTVVEAWKRMVLSEVDGHEWTWVEMNQGMDDDDDDGHDRDGVRGAGCVQLCIVHNGAARPR